MNINEVSAALSYGSVQNSQNALSRLSADFAAIFDRADETAQAFSTRHVDAQAVVEALSEAELALQTAVTIRDRVVAAYQDILRMPI